MNMVEEQIKAIQNTIQAYKQKKNTAKTSRQQHYCQQKIDQLTMTLTGLLPDYKNEYKDIQAEVGHEG